MPGGLKNGVCAACGSDEVYHTDSPGYQVLVGRFGMDRAPIDNYACGGCGYTEFYINGEDLDKVRSNWTRLRKKQT